MSEELKESKENVCCCEKREEIRNFMTEDWRRGEKRIQETCDEKVTEVYMEPLKMNLFKKIREEKCPVVCHRETETYDADGNIIEKLTEDLSEEQKKLRMVDHIATESRETPKPQYVTKEEFVGLADELKGAVEAIGESMQQKQVRKVSAQNLLEDEVKNVDKDTWINLGFLVAFLAEVAVLGWIVYF